MDPKSAASAQIIFLPKGGGALCGTGEKCSPDFNTGTGNFTAPIALPRNALKFSRPQDAVEVRAGEPPQPSGEVTVFTLRLPVK